MAAGGAAVIIGLDPGKVDDTVKTLAKDGKAYRQRRRTWPIVSRPNGYAGNWPTSTPTPPCWSTRRGFLVPKPFLDYDGADYNSYLELNRAIFFLTQTVARGMVARRQGGSIVNIGCM